MARKTEKTDKTEKADKTAEAGEAAHVEPGAEIGNYDFKKIEESVLAFWEKHDTYKKVKAKGAKGKPFFFIQGPPYTSGRIHMGHAWNNGLKDMVLRYKRMQGFKVFDRAAYDQHGLPTERKVMQNLKMEGKDEIAKMGEEKFVKECLRFSEECAQLMNKDLARIGVWLDYENACLPIRNSYIEGEWFLVKKAHEKGRLYEGMRTISWCANCQTAMAKHECEYKEVKEPSIFVKFPVKGKEKEFLIIWTTTPWTIAYNLAIMVNPELEYVKAKVGDEVWILSKQLAAPVIQMFTKHKLEIIEEFLGEQLEGLEYIHPWDKKWDHYKELKAKHPKTHTVILSTEYVDTTAGTGLVHCAPGCGPEDYEVGYRNNIPAFNNLREDGVFPESMGEFAGLRAKKDDLKFVEAMEKDGILIATTEVEHDYAHCERCRTPVIFRTTKQWFFKVEDLKQKMIEQNEEVYWVPETVKRAFKSWLENLRDNSITKQRVWGTPVPIWKCPTCGKYEVIGSALELKEKAGHCPENLHKPWIDEVKINCKCGDMMVRIPDILDVWIDAGTLCWNILDYPQNKKLYNEMFPADFILEAKEQVRGWFNLLVVASALALDRQPFKAVYVHGMLTDVEGKKMSKSLGNVISPYEVIDKHGADTLRMYALNTVAGEDMNFSWDEIALRQRNISVLWNTHKYLIEQSRVYGIKPDEISSNKGMDYAERFMISKTHSAVKKATELFESYHIDEVPEAATNLFLDLSRTYIQLTRDKSATGSDEEKKAVLDTIFDSMMKILKITAPVCPFVTEQMYQNFRKEFKLKEDSIHSYAWPKADHKLIDAALESRFEIAQNIMQAALFAREKIQLGVRWPVKEIIIESASPEVKDAVKALEELIKTQINVKSVRIVDVFTKAKTTLKADYTKMGPEFGEKAPEIIAKLATAAPESVLQKLEKEGRYGIILNNKEKCELLKEHLIIKKEVPDSHFCAESRYGNVYLDKERTPELEAEGYAREVMRRIQALRKETGLVKTDRISLFMQADQGFCAMIKPWQDSIKEKVGAAQINITHNEPAKMHQHKKQLKVKDKEFVVEFDKL